MLQLYSGSGVDAKGIWIDTLIEIKEYEELRPIFHSPNLYNKTVLGRLRDYLRLLMGRTLAYFLERRTQPITIGHNYYNGYKVNNNLI